MNLVQEWSCRCRGALRKAGVSSSGVAVCSQTFEAPTAKNVARLQAFVDGVSELAADDAAEALSSLSEEADDLIWIIDQDGAA